MTIVPQKGINNLTTKGYQSYHQLPLPIVPLSIAPAPSQPHLSSLRYFLTHHIWCSLFGVFALHLLVRGILPPSHPRLVFVGLPASPINWLCHRSAINYGINRKAGRPTKTGGGAWSAPPTQMGVSKGMHIFLVPIYEKLCIPL